MPTLLRGSQLDAWLDQVYEAVEQNNTADLTPDLKTNMLRDMLTAQECAPDEPGALYRLQRLWCIAGEVEKALALIDQYAPLILVIEEQEERADYEFNIAFWRLDAWCFTDDVEKISASLTDVATALLSQTKQGNGISAWHRLINVAENHKLWALMRQFATNRLAAEHALEQRSQWRAFDSSKMHLALCRSFHFEGRAAEANEAAQTAINALSEAGNEEQVGFSDWITLGESIVFISPALIPQTIAYARLLLPKDIAPGKLRDAEIQIARLEAKMHYYAGDLDKAIARARDGRYGLTSDSNDNFSALLLRWILEAGREDEAAELAFESANGERPGSQEEALQLALDKVNTTPNIYWHLTLAGAALREGQQWVCGNEDSQQFYQHHLAQARILDPAHPSLLSHEIERMLEVEKKPPESALPLLEQLTALPDFPLFYNLVSALLKARMQIHGIDKMLSMPFVPTGAAGWEYNMGCIIEDIFADTLNKKIPQELRDKIYSLQGRYYQEGLKRFEAFFASGKGHFRDADIHVYSMLCNNLGIYYRNDANSPDHAGDCRTAIELHRKGLTTSPFAEHYDSILQCLVKLEDHERIIEAGEDLWHYSNQYGYGRHSPPDYFQQVTGSLSKIDRDLEIGIWLERLDQWFANQDREESEKDYRLCQAWILAQMSWEQPDDVAIRLASDCTNLEKFIAQEPGIAIYLGLAYTGCSRFDDALRHQQLALKYSLKLGEQELADLARRNIASLKKHQIKENKPWWKIWG
ncbi:hypothetical protein [Serratia sp. DD3]|uniref:hypothetical protein n=1 Tax=Serratia sp. DD3 TaxID=1410619 RepID=UPI0003C50F94|nr:hypothetical protein [Serratia sp. DD3]KEY60925.1 hypothetical protein SRDD_00990 [Serratia sp. DD3]